jgi:Tol biopolymer transport system component
VRRAFGICLVATALIVAAGAGARSRAANGRIGYLRPLGGNEPPYFHLFAVNPDGSAALDLTPAGYTDIRSFAWSPDGRRIAFSAIADGDHDPELYVMSSSGGGVRRLTNNSLSDFDPTWSPDGRWLAFTSIRTGLSQIYRMRADGSRQRRLTNAFANCEAPAWSPRGNLIAFEYRWASNKVVVIRPDGTHARVLLHRRTTLEGNPTWSPDGRVLAFGRGTPGPSWRPLGTWTIKPSGHALRRLLAHGGDPAFAPDGRWLAFVWNRNGNEELYKARADGSGIAQLTSTGGIAEADPGWQRAP